MALSSKDLSSRSLAMAVPCRSCWSMTTAASARSTTCVTDSRGRGCRRDSAMACTSWSSAGWHGRKVRLDYPPRRFGRLVSTGDFSKVPYQELIASSAQMLTRTTTRSALPLTSCLVFAFVDSGSGVVRSISASISEMSSAEKPFVIVVSPVFDVLKWPPVLPCSELESLDFRRVKMSRTMTMRRESTMPAVTDTMSTK